MKISNNYFWKIYQIFFQNYYLIFTIIKYFCLKTNACFITLIRIEFKIGIPSIPTKYIGINFLIIYYLSRRSIKFIRVISKCSKLSIFSSLEQIEDQEEVSFVFWLSSIQTLSFIYPQEEILKIQNNSGALKSPILRFTHTRLILIVSSQFARMRDSFKRKMQLLIPLLPMLLLAAIMGKKFQLFKQRRAHFILMSIQLSHSSKSFCPYFHTKEELLLFLQ